MIFSFSRVYLSTNIYVDILNVYDRTILIIGYF